MNRQSKSAIKSLVLTLRHKLEDDIAISPASAGWTSTACPTSSRTTRRRATTYHERFGGRALLDIGCRWSVAQRI